MNQIFSTCDLVVMGFYLERTLRPVDKRLAAIRNIVYGTGSAFTVRQTYGEYSVIVDSRGNMFTLSIDNISTLFEKV